MKNSLIMAVVWLAGAGRLGAASITNSRAFPDGIPAQEDAEVQFVAQLSPDLQNAVTEVINPSAPAAPLCQMRPDYSNSQRRGLYTCKATFHENHTGPLKVQITSKLPTEDQPAASSSLTIDVYRKPSNAEAAQDFDIASKAMAGAAKLYKEKKFGNTPEYALEQVVQWLRVQPGVTEVRQSGNSIAFQTKLGDGTATNIFDPTGRPD